MTYSARRAKCVTSVLAALALLALAGCLGGPAAGDANASDGPGDASDGTDGDEAAFAVQITDGNRSLDADASGEATVELRYDSTGGTVRETSWDTIETPSGSSTGVLDYDDYAEIRLTGTGDYVVQLTATSADGTIAHDTVTLTVE